MRYANIKIYKINAIDFKKSPKDKFYNAEEGK